MKDKVTYSPSNHSPATPVVLEGMCFAATLGIIIIPLFGVLDWISLYELDKRAFLNCVAIRAVMTMACGLFAALAQKFFRRADWKGDTRSIRLGVSLGAAMYLIVGIGTAWLARFVGGGETPYFAGMLMVYVGVSIMTPWHPRYTAWLMMVLSLAYIALAHKQWPPSVAAVTNLVFLAGGGVVSWWGSTIVYRLHLAKIAAENQTNERIAGVVHPALEGDGVAAPNDAAIEGLKLKALMIQALVILALPFAGFFVPAASQESPQLPLQTHGPYFLALNGAGKRDESLEFLNRLGVPITLKSAQLVIGDEKFDVLAAGQSDIIRPGEKFRIYTRNEAGFTHHLGQTNSLAPKLQEQSVRIYGFRLP